MSMYEGFKFEVKAWVLDVVESLRNIKEDTNADFLLSNVNDIWSITVQLVNYGAFRKVSTPNYNLRIILFFVAVFKIIQSINFLNNLPTTVSKLMVGRRKWIQAIYLVCI